jgi:hypothetical protein
MNTLLLLAGLFLSGQSAASPPLQTVTDKYGDVWAVYPTNRPDLDRIRAQEARASKVAESKIEIEDPATGLTIPSPQTARRASGDRRVNCNSVTYNRMRTARVFKRPEYKAMRRCIMGKTR